MRKSMGRESTEEEMVENEMLGEEGTRRRTGRRTRRVHNVEPQAELALASTAGKPEKNIFNFFFFFSFSLLGRAGNPEIDDYVYSVNCT